MSPETWDVIATVSQALAAFGALALLYITWRSGKETKIALENSRKLAEATDNLVLESRAQQELAVLPVIEVSDERGEGRIRFRNKGNGPLLKPTLEIDGTPIKLLGQTNARAEYAEVAALSVEGDALINIEHHATPNGRLSISGFTLTGLEYRAFVSFDDFSSAKRLVAERQNLNETE